MQNSVRCKDHSLMTSLFGGWRSTKETKSDTGGGRDRRKRQEVTLFFQPPISKKLRDFPSNLFFQANFINIVGNSFRGIGGKLIFVCPGQLSGQKIFDFFQEIFWKNDKT